MCEIDQDWTGKWMAKTVEQHTNVGSVRVLSPQMIRIRRQKYGAVRIATLSLLHVRNRHVEEIVNGASRPHFVVNIPVESYWSGKAIESLENRSISFGGIADLYRALNERAVRTYVNPEFAFVTRGLTQHTNVLLWRRIQDRKFQIDRYEGRAVTVVFLNEYDVTADSVRTARERYGPCDVYVSTNPNSRVSSVAGDALTSMDIPILDWAEFFGYLGKSGE